MDGSLRYIGRKDTQAKLYGQRLELREVEYHVSQCFPHSREVIAEVISVCLPDEEEQAVLAAFVWSDNTTSEDDHAIQVLRPATADFLADAQQARQQLEQRIPRYMVPGAFIPLYRMPLTHNGKIDRRWLRRQASQMPREELFTSLRARERIKCAPTTKTEQLLRSIIAEVLKKAPDDIGMDDNLFQLGMDSVVMIRFVRLARQRGLDIRATDVFRQPKLSDLAELYERSRESTADEALPIAGPLTSN
jgi:aryl carrier-like protein